MMLLSHSVIIALLLVLAGCGPQQQSSSELKVGARPVGHFKGLVTIEEQINQRLYEGMQPLDMSLILGDELNSLLGVFSGEATTSKLEGSAPNPVNVLLWEVLMDATADSLALSIKEKTLNPAAQDAVDQLFALEPAADASQALRDVWNIFMRYDAPEAEREAWVEAMQEPGSEFKTEADPARSVLQSVLLHPYFLLAH